MHAGELIGTGIAGLGAVMLAAGSGANKGVTLIGDLACLAATSGFITYMSIGRGLRAWIGLFEYIFPVTGEPCLLVQAGLELQRCDGTSLDRQLQAKGMLLRLQ